MEILFNKTKIVATLGPASDTREKIQELIEAGVDVFRLNFSHSKTPQEHAQKIQYVRELNLALGTSVALLQDLQGPKIRVETVANNGVVLEEGKHLTITIDHVEEGTNQRVSTSYQALPQDVEVGHRVLIDDGNLELRVVSKTAREVVCMVIYGGVMKSRKGINLPDSQVSASSLPEKDYQDLMFGLDNNIDWVALSFVRTAADVLAVQDIIKKQGKHTKLIAKIETPQAVEHIDEILAVSDGIMVARGDLGVELPMEVVPVIQKTLVKKCNDAGKPVIVATQMLESMINNPRPTRAEASDVANAVMDGADAVMLSAESASGKYPLQSVQSMTKIIREIEENLDAIYDKKFDLDSNSEYFLADSLIAQACNLAHDTKAKAICSLTSSGYSAHRLSQHRPKANIFIFTRHPHLMTRLSLLWGVRTVLFARSKPTDETIEEVKELLVNLEHLKKGDVFINLATIPATSGNSQRVNMVKVSVV